MRGIHLDMYRKEDGSYSLPDGIYFGLAEDIYHSDKALGSTSIKGLATKPYKWQRDRIRPKDTEREPEHLKWGRAFHCRVLEGKAEFDERYAEPPSPADYPFPAYFHNSDQIRAFLKEHGMKVSGSKAEVFARAQEIDGCPRLFDDVVNAWWDAHPKHEDVSKAQLIEIEDAVANMARDPSLSAVMTAGSLINGAAELSIIYTDERGIRRKARLDYAIPMTGGRPYSMVVDLKSFTTFRSGTDEEGGVRKVYDEFYDVQAGYYRDAIDAARLLAANEQVFGDCEEGFLRDLLGAPKHPFMWVWVMMRRDNGMIPIILAADIYSAMINHGNDIARAALDTYHHHVTTQGADQLWTPAPRVPRLLDAQSLPSYNRGATYEQPADR